MDSPSEPPHSGASPKKALLVTACNSTGKGSLSGGAIAGSVIGVLAGVALIGALIYFLYFRMTGRASKQLLSEKKPLAPKHGEDTTVYENIVYLNDSTLPAQGLGTSCAFPETPPEGLYQTLDISRVGVYDKILPWKNPQA